MKTEWMAVLQLGDIEVDFVHEDHATQDDIYQETFRPIVNAFLQVLQTCKFTAHLLLVRHVKGDYGCNLRL